MTRSEMENHARAWIDAWNRRDVDAVLGHYVDDAVFVSPKALTFVGTARISGKDQLAAYWRTASQKIQTLIFRLDRVICDPEGREMVVLYEATLNGTTSRACELMRFDAAGRQIGGEALYGAVL
jgi:ketosteroid isomerase-like protein